MNPRYFDFDQEGYFERCMQVEEELVEKAKREIREESDYSGASDDLNGER